MVELKIDLAGRRILVVEDEWVIARETAKAFQKCGAEVVGPAATLDHALKLVDDLRPTDVAVVDINLRGEMAFPVADALEARGIRYVFATGYDGPIIPPRFAKILRCEKPADPRKIVKALFE